MKLSLLREFTGVRTPFGNARPGGIPLVSEILWPTTENPHFELLGSKRKPRFGC
jgi:hypothetical protein